MQKQKKKHANKEMYFEQSKVKTIYNESPLQKQ